MRPTRALHPRLRNPILPLLPRRILRPIPIPIALPPPLSITAIPSISRAPARRGAIARIRDARVFVGEVDGFLGRSRDGNGVRGPGVARGLGAGAAGFAEGGGADGEVLDLGEGEDAEDCDVVGAAGVC